MSVQQELKPRPKLTKEGILLKCPHACCNGRVWKYRGNMTVYAVCSNCRKPVSIESNRVKE